MLIRQKWRLQTYEMGYFYIRVHMKNSPRFYWFFKHNLSTKFASNYTFYTTRRKKSYYKSKNTGHAFVAGFVLAILVKNSSFLSGIPLC